MKYLLHIASCIVFVFLCALTGFILLGRKEALPPVKLPIIIYHHFSYDEAMWGDSTMSPELFKEHMTAIKAKGYTAVSYKEVLAFAEGRGKLPDKPVLIAIDDGYLSNYEYAYPILKELGMKASISVIGWSVGKTQYKDGSFEILPHFSWEQAKEMVDSGVIEIDAHSFDMHELGEWLLTRVGVSQEEGESDSDYRKALDNDFTTIFELIKGNIGKQPLCLTYPYGIYSEASEASAMANGFKITAIGGEAVNTIAVGDSLNKLKRFTMHASYSPEKLISLLEGE